MNSVLREGSKKESVCTTASYEALKKFSQLTDLLYLHCRGNCSCLYLCCLYLSVFFCLWFVGLVVGMICGVFSLFFWLLVKNHPTSFLSFLVWTLWSVFQVVCFLVVDYMRFHCHANSHRNRQLGLVISSLNVQHISCLSNWMHEVVLWNQNYDRWLSRSNQ